MMIKSSKKKRKRKDKLAGDMFILPALIGFISMIRINLYKKVILILLII